MAALGAKPIIKLSAQSSEFPKTLSWHLRFGPHAPAAARAVSGLSHKAALHLSTITQRATTFCLVLVLPLSRSNLLFSTPATSPFPPTASQNCSSMPLTTSSHGVVSCSGALPASAIRSCLRLQLLALASKFFSRLLSRSSMKEHDDLLVVLDRRQILGELEHVRAVGRAGSEQGVSLPPARART